MADVLIWLVVLFGRTSINGGWYRRTFGNQTFTDDLRYGPQDYDGPFEVTLALGPSIDGTTELVEEMAAVDPRIRVVVLTASSITISDKVQFELGKAEIPIRP